MKSFKALFCVLGVLTLAGCANDPNWTPTSKYDRPEFAPGKGLAGPYDVVEWSWGRPSDLEDYIGPAPVGYTDGDTDMYDFSNVETNPALMPAPQMTYNTPPRLPQTLLQPRQDYGDVSVYSIPGDHDITSLMTQTPDQQLYFNYGSARIGSGDRQKLKNLSKKAGNNPVSVIGHASKRVDGVKDPHQKKEINYQMAKQRADAVTNVLQKDGIPATSITAVSRGDDEPNPNPGHRGQEPADRRVDIYIGQ